MIDRRLSDSIRRALFGASAAPLYAIVDGAATRAVLQGLYEFEPEYACLYSGELEPDLMETAPYLVRLAKDAQFTHWLVENGWGKHWCIFATTGVEMRVLRTHFRKFLVVKGDDGRSFYFRYYDPRVMRNYLPTSTDTEVGNLFGPIESYLIEGSDPSRLLRFSRASGELRSDEIDLASADASHS